MRARSFFSGGNDSNAVPKGAANLMANDGGGRRSRRRRCGIVVVVVVAGKIISCTFFLLRFLTVSLPLLLFVPFSVLPPLLFMHEA